MPSTGKHNAGHLAVTAEDSLRGAGFKRALRVAVVLSFVFLPCIPGAAQTMAQPGGDDCTTKSRASWSVVEQRAWERICAGEFADLNLRNGRNLDPGIDTHWDEECLVSPGFLESAP